MTATYTQVKEALGDTLKTVIPGLRTYPHLSGQINPPAAIIQPGPGQFLTYRTSNVTHDLELQVLLVVEFGSDRSADKGLSDYIADSGDLSVYAAINGNNTLGGVVDDAWVVAAQDWQVYTIAGIPYLGVVFPVRVLL